MPPLALNCRSLLLGLILLSSGQAGAAASCVLHDDSVNDLTVWCPTAFSFAVSRAGVIKGIFTGAGGRVSAGGGCLFSLVGPGYSCSPCGCVRQAVAKLSYRWDNATTTLEFTYVATLMTAVVALRASGGEASYFDATFTLLRPPADPAYSFSALRFPDQASFPAAGIFGLHLPMLPGVTLRAPFFDRGGIMTLAYPGVTGCWAAWWHADVANGSLSVYDLSGPDAIMPYAILLQPLGAARPAADFVFTAAHRVNVTANCSVRADGVPGNSGAGSGSGPANYVAPPCGMGFNGSLSRRFRVSPSAPHLSICPR
jgi:hypothetical protein